MKRLSISMIVCAAALAAIASVARAEAGAGNVKKIDIQRQLRFKRRLQLGPAGSLVAAIRENRSKWDQFSPEQQRLLRERAYAFRDADPKKQQKVINAYAKFLKLDRRQQELYRQRAAWLKKVLKELSPLEKARLLKLAPADRARELLRLKKDMEAAEAAEAETPSTKPTN